MGDPPFHPMGGTHGVTSREALTSSVTTMGTRCTSPQELVEPSPVTAAGPMGNYSNQCDARLPGTWGFQAAPLQIRICLSVSCPLPEVGKEQGPSWTAVPAMYISTTIMKNSGGSSTGEQQTRPKIQPHLLQRKPNQCSDDVNMPISAAASLPPPSKR